MVHDASDFLTTADAARLIDRTPATVRRAAALGLLRVAATTRSGVRLYRRADIDRYLAERARTREQR
jgi:DNA-binding transcriptional MerR regulator